MGVVRMDIGPEDFLFRVDFASYVFLFTVDWCFITCELYGLDLLAREKCVEMISSNSMITGRL